MGATSGKETFSHTAWIKPPPISVPVGENLARLAWRRREHDKQAAINKIPNAPPLMNNVKMVRSKSLTAPINAGYRPVNSSRKLPEIPGKSIADKAMAPAKGL